MVLLVFDCVAGAAACTFIDCPMLLIVYCSSRLQNCPVYNSQSAVDVFFCYLSYHCLVLHVETDPFFFRSFVANRFRYIIVNRESEIIYVFHCI